MYYNINLEWDPKIIGVKNGIYQVDLNEKVYEKETFRLLESIFINPEFTAVQEYPKIDFNFYFRKLKATKETNIMSFCPNINHGQFLIDNRSLEIFQKFNIQRYEVYDSTITDNGGKKPDYSYKLFYCVLQDWNVIDFENTIFTTGGIGNAPLIEHKFSDEKEFKSLSLIKHVKTLALSKDFDNSLDFFLTRLGGLFVSERLKEAIESNGLTGVYFTNKIEVIM